MSLRTRPRKILRVRPRKSEPDRPYTAPTAITSSSIATTLSTSFTQPTWTSSTSTYQITGTTTSSGGTNGFLSNWSSNNQSIGTTGSYNTSSGLAIAAGTVSGCSGMQAKGGEGTYFAGAIYAAGAALAAQGAAVANSQNAMIILSDGDARTPFRAQFAGFGSDAPATAARTIRAPIHLRIDGKCRLRRLRPRKTLPSMVDANTTRTPLFLRSPTTLPVRRPVAAVPMPTRPITRRPKTPFPRALNWSKWPQIRATRMQISPQAAPRNRLHLSPQSSRA